MTERRYYYSDDLQGQARVLSCAPAEAGAYAVELDATLFHPQGGGQPSDVGSLGGVTVLRVQQQGIPWCTLPPRRCRTGRLRCKSMKRSVGCTPAGTPLGI
ncbi:putative threonyl/alanyl tRNA synthetase SAD [Serratia marcescens]|nr:putative threonyl/alanyl tRNA synthetase SAD [Serratia marcescens]